MNDTERRKEELDMLRHQIRRMADVNDALARAGLCENSQEIRENALAIKKLIELLLDWM